MLLCLLLRAPQHRDKDSGVMQVSGQLHARHGGESDSRVFHLARNQFRQLHANLMSQPLCPASRHAHANHRVK